MLLRITSLAIAMVLALPAYADQIHTCATKTTGKMRLAADPGQCTDREIAVSWNSEGPQGEDGPEGPQGPEGSPGDPAPAPPRFELVGFTSDTFQGDQGVLGFTLACQAEFPGSRMCDTQEIFKTVNVPPGLVGDAWVNPVLRPLASTSTVSLDISGVANSPGSHTCYGWATTSSTGLTVGVGGQIGPFSNCNTLHSVSCCAPVE